MRRPALVLLVAGVLVAAGGPPARGAGRLTVVDVADRAGVAATVNDEYGNGLVLDYDRDGVPDLLLSRHYFAPTQLFHGHRDGTFTEVQDLPTADRHGCDAGDLDGDGRVDLFCSVGADHGTSNSKADELWRQTSTGRFMLVPGAWGATDPSGRGRDVAVLDGDGDGRPDVFVGNGVPVDFPSTNHLFLNRGHRLVDDPALGSTPGTSGLCVAQGDLAGDGRPDLYVCGAYDTDHLYVSRGGGRYDDGLAAAGLPPARSRDAQLADVDHDGRLDLLRVSDTAVELFLRRGARLVPAWHQALRAGRAAQVLDADGDGRLDLYVVQGHLPGVRGNLPDLLLLGDGTGRAFRGWPGLPQARVGGGDEVSLLPHYPGGPALLVTNGGDGGPEYRGPRQLLVFRRG